MRVVMRSLIVLLVLGQLPAHASNDVVVDVDDVSFLQAQLEVHGAEARKPMIWIHVHKSGGTTICGLAELNNETIVPELEDGEGGGNCNWGGIDDMLFMNASINISCEERRNAFAKNGWTFGMIEREIHHDDICDGFMYGVMIREPVSRAMSFANFDLVNVTEDVACLRAGVPCQQRVYPLREIDFDEWTMTPHGPSFPSWIIFDNYMIRTLLGSDGLNIPPTQVTDQHAQQVINKLSKFDMVTFVEELGDQTPQMLTDNLGWEKTDPDLVWDNPSFFEQSVSDEDMAYLEDLNKMDQILYEHFKHVPVEARGR